MRMSAGWRPWAIFKTTNMTTVQARAIADEIIALYEQHGGSAYAGEKVSQLEHMVQAAQLASKRTLAFQGGSMSDEEALAFEQYPLFDLMVCMRLWDEEAKIEGLPVPNLAKYRTMMVRHLEVRAAAE